MQHKVTAPFLRSKFCDFDGDTISESWRPGVEYRMCAPDDSEAYCNAVGEMILTEVSRHKPGRYPTRVFYLREWVNPDGKKFGKPALRMCSAEKFSRLSRGWAVDYVVDPDEMQHGA